jgi:hypothetical protein
MQTKQLPDDQWLFLVPETGRSPIRKDMNSLPDLMIAFERAVTVEKMTRLMFHMMECRDKIKWRRGHRPAAIQQRVGGLYAIKRERAHTDGKSR